jgi:hypothetical protein
MPAHFSGAGFGIDRLRQNSNGREGEGDVERCVGQSQRVV